MKPTFLKVGALVGSLAVFSCSHSNLPGVRTDRISVPVGSSDVRDASAGVPLSQVILEDQIGLDSEGEAQKFALLDQARVYVRIKERRATLQEKSKFAKDCSQSKIAVEFCSDLYSQSRGNSARSRDSRSIKRVSAHQVRAAFHKGNLSAILQATDADLISYLRKANLSAMSKILAQVESTSECVPTPITSTLGYRLETALPDPTIRERVLKLYERSAACGSDMSAIRARYRMALLQVADKRFKEADQNLAVVIESPVGMDYRSRSLYWRFKVQQELGNSSLARDIKKRLVAEFPFSLHGLVVDQAEPRSFTNREPLVKMRSDLRPGVNPILRAIEATQRAGGFESSLDLVEDALAEARDAEPGVQLYVAVMLRRAGDTVRKFSLLAVLFREHPELVSQKSLEMLYPNTKFELVAAEDQVADPYVMISLMRQESAFNHKAKSRVGALGLMQVMPATARRMDRSVSKAKLLDPKTNVRIGAQFFSKMLERFDGNVEFALAAYNAGPERVDDWKKRYPVADRLLFLDLIPYKETREYVASIARNYYWYTRLYPTTKRAPASFVVFNRE